MTIVSVDEAQARLLELIELAKQGEEVIITKDDQPIAKLIAIHPAEQSQRRTGSATGKLTILAEDDDHLKDFEEYMP